MRTSIQEVIVIPEGITCELKHNVLACKKGGETITKKFDRPGITLKVNGGTIEVSHVRANRKDIAIIKAVVAHIRNLFRGLEKGFVYYMEICNVHFPMTVKIEGSKLIINNFLGEKEKRFASIVPGVKVDVKGQQIILSGADVESVGQSAANIEKATWVANRDRRVFQDGIFITSKDGEEI